MKKREPAQLTNDDIQALQRRGVDKPSETRAMKDSWQKGRENRKNRILGKKYQSEIDEEI